MKRLNSKGFTLVEILGVIVILAILMGIAIPGVTRYIKNGKQKYHEALEKEVVIMARNYFSDNKSMLPRGQKNNKGEPTLYEEISLTELEKHGYVTRDVVDANKNPCDRDFSYVKVYRDDDGSYHYDACLVCGGYTTPQCSNINDSDSDLDCEFKFNSDWSDEAVSVDLILSYPPNSDKNGVPLLDFAQVTKVNGVSEGRVIKNIDKNKVTYSATKYISELEILVQDGRTIKTCKLGKNQPIKIDTVKPTCTVSDAPGVDNTYRTITIVGSDNESGVERIEFAGTNLELEDGVDDNSKVGKVIVNENKSYVGSVVDHAGNRTECEIVTIDSIKYVTGISVTTPPSKLVYYEDDKFDSKGMIITAIYSDGTSKNINNYDLSNNTNLKVGQTSVIVSYTEKGKTVKTSQDITVKPNVSSIRVTTAPSTTTYKQGESFNKLGMVVTATYTDGTTRTITNYEITDGSSLDKDQTSVTISYTENGITKTCAQAITVKSVFTNVVISGESNATHSYVDQTTVTKKWQVTGTSISIPSQYRSGVTSVSYSIKIVTTKHPNLPSTSTNDGDVRYYVYYKNAAGTTKALQNFVSTKGIGTVVNRTFTYNISDGMQSIWIVTGNYADATAYGVSTGKLSDVKISGKY